MYGELYQYFIQYRRLHMPGIGTFLLERKPAVSDFPNRIINPPTFHIALQQSSNGSPGNDFYRWLAQHLRISERDAVVRFNDFIFQMKRDLQEGHSIQWNGVGVISRGLANEIKFDPDTDSIPSEQPVKAEKVIREKAEHTVRVGESEKTSAQMIELLKQPEVRKSHWWAWALIIGLLLVMFLGWYFSVYGIRPSSTGNSQKISPVESGTPYRQP
jgi:hypothetical protein